MPVRIRKKKGGCYEVSTPRGIKARCATKENAESQGRLLRAIDKRPTPRGTGKRRKGRSR